MDQFRKKLIIELSVVGGIVAVLAVVFLLLGFYIGTASERIVAARTELLERSASVGSLANLRETWRTKAEGYLTVLRRVIPAKDTLINVSRDFQSLASQTRTEYSFSFLGETREEGEGIGTLGFRLTLRGDLVNIFSFVDKFAKFPYLSTIDNFTIERKGPGARSELLAQGRIFFR
jgi:Tfp pilus assembly protein PilO